MCWRKSILEGGKVGKTLLQTFSGRLAGRRLKNGAGREKVETKLANSNLSGENSFISPCLCDKMIISSSIMFKCSNFLQNNFSFCPLRRFFDLITFNVIYPISILCKTSHCSPLLLFCYIILEIEFSLHSIYQVFHLFQRIIRWRRKQINISLKSVFRIKIVIN